MWRKPRREWEDVPRKSVTFCRVQTRLPNEPESDVIEVRGDDGMFRQGRIADCAEGGLLIEWGCEGEAAPHFAPFGEIFLHRHLENKEICNITNKENLPVEVLIRRNPKDVRTWYPGTIIAGQFISGSTSYGLVDVVLSDGAKRVVVPGQRIRQPLTEDEQKTRRVHEGHFCKDMFFAPQLLSPGVDNEQGKLSGVLNGRSRLRIEETRTLIRALRIDSDWLHYIRIGYDIVPKEQQYQSANRLQQFIRLAIRDHTRLQEQNRKRKLSESDSESDQERSEDEAPNHDTTIAIPAYGIQFLPKHILVCVFQEFDSAEQCRLRKVCAYWDSILTSPDVTRIVRVRYDNMYQDYSSVASLYNGWTVHTRVVVSARLDAGDNRLICGGHLFRTLIQKCGFVPLQTIIMIDVACTLNRCARDSCLLSLGQFAEDLNSMAATCENLVLRNVEVKIHNCCWSQKALYVHIVTGCITGALTVKKLWELMDDSFPAVAEVRLHQLSEWIKGSSEQDRMDIEKILNDRQSSDPRENVNFRGRSWTGANLVTLELGKLSKFTLHSLIAKWNRTSLTITLSW